MKTSCLRFTSFAISILLLSAMLVYAGNGKIAGTVKDAVNKNPIPGVNITLVGTTMGASANPDGQYFILNIPPGVYDVVASAVGFGRSVVRGIEVSSDRTSTVDFELREAAVGLEEVVVEAERKLVDKTLTATKSVISTDELNNTLPILSVYELVNTSASVFKGRIRGSQIAETKTLLDGVDITDQFGHVDYSGAGDISAAQRYNRVTKAYEYNNTVVDYNASGLAELDVVAGAANAEYVAATAGVYNASLREGRGPWSGRVFFRAGGGNFSRFMKGPGYFGPDFYPASDTSKYLTNKRTLAAAGNAKASRYIWTPGQYEIGETPTYNGDVSLGGGVGENLGLFFTGSLYDTHGFMPNEFNREANLSLKANYEIESGKRVVVTGLLQDRGQLFGWKNRTYNDASRYFLQGVPVNDGYSGVASAKFTHVLSPESFYEVQVSHVKRSSRIGFLDAFTDSNGDGIPDTYDQTQGSADFLVLGYDTARVRKYIGAIGSGKFFNNNNDDTQGIDATITNIIGNGQVLANPTYYYENLQTSVTTLKADFTTQITVNHQLRLGGQLRLHSISMDRRATVIVPTDIDPAVGVLVEPYEKKPKEFGFYAQDRMEFSGLIVNVGARLDGLNLDAAEFANYYTPYYNPVTGSSSAGFRSDFVPLRGAEVKTKLYFSPRIGVSHPISENSTMYFSYSNTSQPLPFSQIYTGYNNVNNPSLPNQVRVDQDPYKSTNYEFGATWEFLPRLSLNANAYFRQIENYLRYAYTVSGLVGQTVTTYNVSFNSGYANAQGVELTLILGQVSIPDIVKISGRANYAWSVIKGPAGGPAANKSTFAKNTADSVFTQLPFDDAKNYKAYLINIGGGQSVLGAGFDRTHRVGFTLFFQFPAEISLSAVGTYASGFLYTNPTVDNRTARQLVTAPSNSQLDLRLEKAFSFSGRRIAAFLDVKNVFNKKNILGYATGTGTSQILFYKTGDPTGDYHRSILEEGTSVYDLPRQVYLGFYFEF
ncbi:MAG: TonB-dependent receptor [Bacteroidota bacterium]